VDYLFSGWRLAHPPHHGADGLAHANLEPAPGKSLFETIEQSGLADEITYVIHRTADSFVLLNVYPYTPGHVMVLPLQAVPSMLDLAPEVYDDLWRLVRTATRAVTEAFKPQGLNIGINEGRAGGGSQPDHLHVHIVPRWGADTNFMTSIADARILPMTLGDAWSRLRAVWPDDEATTESRGDGSHADDDHA
jgi:ATP adenylyltransferase